MYDAWLMIGQMVVDDDFRKMVWGTLEQNKIVLADQASPGTGTSISSYYTFSLQGPTAPTEDDDDPLYALRESIMAAAPDLASMPISLTSVAQLAWTWGDPLPAIAPLRPNTDGSPRTAQTARAALDGVAQAVQAKDLPNLSLATVDGRDTLATLGTLVCDKNFRQRLRDPKEAASPFVKSVVNDAALETTLDDASGSWDLVPVCGLRFDVWKAPTITVGAE